MLRVAVLLLLAWGLLAPAAAGAQSPSIPERLAALRAEIEAGKAGLVQKYAEVRDLEARGDVAGAQLKRVEIEAGKKALLPKYVQLAELEQQALAQGPEPAAAAAPATAAVPAPRPPAPPPAAAVAVAAPSVDPARALAAAPFEAAVIARLGMIRVSVPPKWQVLDERRVVIWVASEEAYLLGLAEPCPALLQGGKPQLQTFSTRVRVGQGAVLAGGQRCVVASIAQLGGRGLPKPPRN